ncbi:MAG: AAA family ATPase [Chloroflexota bacterium]|nr:AAA family ATPase [Chloroflexota bacterium]MDE2959532.1 AAA family ATPase [Chloroflexota bacterium]
MVALAENHNQRPAWFVGAAYGGNVSTGDQTDRFVRLGIWENGYADDTFSELIDSMQPGDRIAIKSFFNSPNRPDLPFDDRGHNVTGMEIKAVGVVVSHLPRERGRRRLKINWTRLAPPRTFYFSAYQQTVHAIYPGEWKRDALIAFAFGNEPQDIYRFRNDPQYRERFGDLNSTHLPGPPNQPMPPEPSATYTIDSILADGCFLDEDILEAMLHRLQNKQNLILQGPPGTGKTWLAKKLAYALIGRKDDSKVRPVQFHPNLSYEDFVRGWRPQGDGRLELVDGPFLQVVEDAGNDTNHDYVMVIEEINRGNPASIFGEMLTLLEADKRNPNEALALAYPCKPEERVYIPPNVYVIGTMNLADRSLTMVDLALRRRFAFFDLEPMLNDTWREWVNEQCGIDDGLLAEVAQRINALNEEIAADRNLGRQFRIGHSFVTPAPGSDIGEPEAWFIQVVATEIVPLLHEYWFDNPDRVSQARSKLLGTA